jgi:hypothetical protein
LLLIVQVDSSHHDQLRQKLKVSKDQLRQKLKVSKEGKKFFLNQRRRNEAPEDRELADAFGSNSGDGREKLVRPDSELPSEAVPGDFAVLRDCKDGSRQQTRVPSMLRPCRAYAKNENA